MGLFSKKQPAAEVVMYLIDECTEYDFDIVGESRCRDHLKGCIRQAPEEARELGEIETIAELVFEPTNEFDRNAIQVWINNGRVGYIAKTDNVSMGNVMRAAFARGGTRVLVMARIGWDSESSDPLIGVRLRLYPIVENWRTMTRDEMVAESEAQ